jgi:hypothetical protein
MFFPSDINMSYRASRSVSPSSRTGTGALTPPRLPQFDVGSEINLSLNTHRQSERVIRPTHLQIPQPQRAVSMTQQRRPGQSLVPATSTPKIIIHQDTNADSARSSRVSQGPRPIVPEPPVSHSQDERQAPAVAADYGEGSCRTNRWGVQVSPGQEISCVVGTQEPPLSATGRPRSPPPSRIRDNSPERRSEETQVARVSRDSTVLPPVTPEEPTVYDVTLPSCSLMLLCYRSGPGGCERKQVEVVARSRFYTIHEYNRLVKAKPELLCTDRQLFDALQDVYLEDMCSIWRRWFSLKTMRRIQLLEVSQPLCLPMRRLMADATSLCSTHKAHDHDSFHSTTSLCKKSSTHTATLRSLTTT